MLVSTVGPFARWGDAGRAGRDRRGRALPRLDRRAARSSARSSSATGRRAEAAGCGLVTAFGYDWVPGNLAGALALREAGDAATRVDVGYFITGGARGRHERRHARVAAAGACSTRASRCRGGRLVTERGAKRACATFAVAASARPAISVGSSEHFALPRLRPGLREVDVYLGWFGPASRPMQAMSLGHARP